MSMLLQVTSLVLSFTSIVHGITCRNPGYSTRSNVSTTQSDHFFGDFQSNETAYYRCKNPNDTLIGHRTRVCQNGRWSGSIPKCASILTDVAKENFQSNESFTSFDVVSRDERRIQYVEITFFTRQSNPVIVIQGRHVNSTRRDSNSATGDLIKYEVNSTISNSEGIRVASKVKIEEESVNIKVYSVINDNCEMLDFPTFGFVYPTSIDLTNDSTGALSSTPMPNKFTFLCDNSGIRLKLVGKMTVECNLDDEWVSSQCEPTTYCSRLSEHDGYFSIKYNAPNIDYTYNETHVLPGTFANYSCNLSHPILSGQTYRYCNEEGVWLGNEPSCQRDHTKIPTTEQTFGVTNDSDDSLSYLSIILGVGLIALVIVMVVIVVRGRQRIRQFRKLSNTIRQTDNGIDESNGIQGKLFKMSYRMGTNVDDDFSAREFGLTEPTEDKVVNLQPDCNNLLKVRTDEELRNSIQSSIHSSNGPSFSQDVIEVPQTIIIQDSNIEN